MDYKAIEQLIKTASENGLNYLEVETEGMHIKLQKGEINSSLLSNDTVVKKEIKEETAATKTEVPEIKEATTSNENLKSVKSPIVGTFYGSGSPEAEAFVKVGSKVKKGQVLCIIEAMKLMNEIESEFDGEIVEILAENEQMVEYGQQLFKVRV